MKCFYFTHIYIGEFNYGIIVSKKGRLDEIEDNHFTFTNTFDNLGNNLNIIFGFIFIFLHPFILRWLKLTNLKKNYISIYIYIFFKY